MDLTICYTSDSPGSTARLRRCFRYSSNHPPTRNYAPGSTAELNASCYQDGRLIMHRFDEGNSMDLMHTEHNSVIAEVTSIFQQPWWLDAVAPGAWDEVTIEKGGQLVARLPYVVKKHLGFTLISMPPLTQTLGPWLLPYDRKYARQLSEEKE